MRTLGEIAQKVADALKRRETEDADHWAKVRTIAAAIPPDAENDDVVVKALYAARFCAEDFIDLLDEALIVARKKGRQ